MTVPCDDKLPPKPREHLVNAREESDSRAEFQEWLLLIYGVMIHLASIAVSDYRSHVEVPVLEIERKLARPHLKLTEYVELFREASAHTDGTLCSLRRPGQMHFVTGPKLRAAANAARRARDADGARMRAFYEEEVGPPQQEPTDRGRRRRRAPAPPSHDLNEFFHVIQELRNRGYGHLEESRWDTLRDFYEIVSKLMREAAQEFLGHDEVARVLETWYPAEIFQVRRGGGFQVRRFGETVRATDAAGDANAFDRGDTVLVYDDGEQRTLRGPFLSLLDEPKPWPLADAALTAAIDVHEYREAVSATRHDFRNRGPGRSVAEEVIDDLLVMVLEDFKLTVAPLAADPLVGRLDHLLDRCSAGLPSRILRDIDYFTSLSLHARDYGAHQGRNGVRRLMEVARRGTELERGQAIATLGTLCHHNAVDSLMSIVEQEPLSGLRKHALLALGRIGASEAFEFLCKTADDHRRHPGEASYALRALSGRPSIDAVRFLGEYLSCAAPYACLNAAAWSLAGIFKDSPGLATPWVERLLGHIRTLDDPYTRGCLMFALAMTRRQDIAGRIVETVQASADVAGVDPYVLEDTCLAAGLLQDPACAPFLVACAQPDQRDPVVRRQAIVALRRLNTPEAHEALVALPPADERYVRRAQLAELPPSPVVPPQASSAKDVG